MEAHLLVSEARGLWTRSATRISLSALCIRLRSPRFLAFPASSYPTALLTAPLE